MSINASDNGYLAIATRYANNAGTTNVYGSKNGTTNTTKKGSVTLTDDGEDDGKISARTMAKSAVKGVFKTIVNGIKGLNPLKPENWGNILKMGAAIAVSIAFPPAGVAIAAIGGVKAAITVGKGISSACNATTDAEAEAAFEDIGSGAFQLTMSVVGAKAGLKAMKGVKGSAMSELNKGDGLVKTGEAFYKDLKTFGRGGEGASKLAGYKSARFADAIKKAYEDSHEINVASKSWDALKTGTKNAFKETKLGKGYTKELEAMQAKDGGLTGRKALKQKYDALSKARQELRQENSLARQMADDATREAELKVRADKAQKALKDFQDKYEIDEAGNITKQIGEKGAVKIEGEALQQAQAELKRLTDAYETANKNLEAAPRAVKNATQAQENAQKALDEFEKEYSVKDGKVIAKKADIENNPNAEPKGLTAEEAKIQTAKYQKLYDAERAASDNLTKLQGQYAEAQNAATKMRQIQKSITEKQELLKKATEKSEIESLKAEIKTYNESLNDLTQAAKSNENRAIYNTYTGRTNLFRTGMKNWSDAAEAAGYKSRFASAKPAMSTMFDPINEHDTFLMQQEGAYYYYC